ncbi:MAG: SOS response-associated peptidase [Planctomycetaceae bacterium]|nr:SOS response-associated peptidase [Planctomycetaceae bacterium]
MSDCLKGEIDMCGRFTLSTPAGELIRMFLTLDFPEQPPRDNICPTQLVICVRRDPKQEPTRQAVLMRWGLVPFWAKDLSIGSRMINARSETVAEKPSFRRAFRSQRCLIPADGFYEWQAITDMASEATTDESSVAAEASTKRRPRKKKPVKQKWWIHLPDRRPFAFAGLWESWRPQRPKNSETGAGDFENSSDADDSPEVLTCSILTTAANAEMSSVHDRMPVILTPDQHELWLSDKASSAQLTSVMHSLPDGSLELTRC